MGADAAIGAHRVSVRIGGNMKSSIGTAMLVVLTVCGSMPSAQEPKPAASAAAAQDNMTPYRNLAADTLQAFKANDMPTAKKKARELEVAWDKNEKALQKKSPDLWEQIDKAMDGFIKPVMKDKSPDPAKVQTAYDTFIAKLQLAVKTGS